MKNCIPVATHADGTSSLIHGPEVPFTEQRATVHAFRETDVPEGVVRVELWARNCVKFAYQKSPEAARLAELEALIAAEKQAAGGESK